MLKRVKSKRPGRFHRLFEHKCHFLPDQLEFLHLLQEQQLEIGNLNNSITFSLLCTSLDGRFSRAAKRRERGSISEGVKKFS